LWFGEPLPDGQKGPLPAGTCTLWVCGARHQHDLRVRAKAFGLPDDAVRPNARPNDAYGGWGPAGDKDVCLFYELMVAERPGLAIINTIENVTLGRLRRQEKLYARLAPILALAQLADTAVVGLVHLPTGGGTLGRRLDGLACSVLRLARPDPENQPA